MQSGYRHCQILDRPQGRKFQALVIGTALVILSGGATHAITIGLLTLAVGAGLALYPPSERMGRATEACWALLLVWMLLSLCLPAEMTEWRLGSQFTGIDISPAVSPQPIVSIESLVPFLTGSGILLLAHAYRPTGYQRRKQTHLLAGLLCAIGVAAIIAAKMDLRLPWADQVQVFSWFPNRNQTALVFACGSILFFGMAFAPFQQLRSGLARSRRIHRSRLLKAYSTSIMAMLCGSILLYAIFQCLSRGALSGWLCGIVTLVSLRAYRAEKTILVLLRFVPSLAILIFAFFIFMGGASRDRFIDFVRLPLTSVDGSSTLNSELRWQIYTDTKSMIAEQPWTGVGIGQYQYVFPFYRSIPSDPVAFRHPESDWLWWLSELGIIGLTIIVTGLFFLLLRLRATKQAPGEAPHPNEDEAQMNQLYRHIALAALVPFFVHSFVDVGAHRLGTVSIAILLYALALPESNQTSPRHRLVPILWRGSGIVLLFIGLLVLTLCALKSPLLSTHATTARQPLPSRPLQWQPYFRFATLTYPRDPQSGLESFYKARSLMPYNAEIPLSEGFYLLEKGDSASAFAAFNSAVSKSTDPEETFRRILRKSVSEPSNQPYLRSLARNDDALIVEYWRAVPRRLLLESDDLLNLLDRDWNKLSAKAQFAVMKNLNRHKLYAKSLKLYESNHKAQQTQLWKTAVPALVAVGREKEALKLFKSHIVPKPLPQKPVTDKAIQALRAQTVLRPDDPTITTRLLMAYLSRKMWDDASRAAEKSLKLSAGPNETLYWHGFALNKTGREEEAVRAYAQWLSSSDE